MFLKGLRNLVIVTGYVKAGVGACHKGLEIKLCLLSLCNKTQNLWFKLRSTLLKILHFKAVMFVFY